jgi:hypothetical protein
MLRLPLHGQGHLLVLIVDEADHIDGGELVDVPGALVPLLGLA